MIKRISEYITYLMIKNKILNIELYDIYVYSIQVILLNLGILIVCFMISVLIGDIYNLIAFILFFIPIRKLAGGYHCKKARNCFIISIIVYVIPIILIKWGLKLRFVIELFAFISSFLLSKDILNSIDNKKINEYQVERNKILLNKIINFEIIIYVILLKINLKIALQGAVFMNVMNLSTYAYSGEKKITLTKSDMWVSTDSISAKEIAYNGSVYKSSEKNVWFISEYKNATGWHYDTKILVSPGVNCPTCNSTLYTSNTKLRLQLNPYGTQTTGGAAIGKAWPVKQ